MNLLKLQGISLQKSMVEKLLNLDEGFLLDEMMHEDKIVLIDTLSKNMKIKLQIGSWCL